MADVVFVTVVFVFFAVCVVYVRALDSLVRSAEDGDTTASGDTEFVDELVEVVR